MQKSLKGVTLIEVLVASLILLIAISGFLGLFVHNKRVVLSNKQRVIAQSLCEKEFENVRKLRTMNDIKKYLYHDEDTNQPINVNNPLEVTVDNTTYSLYYIDQNANNKPYKLVSLGNDNDPYLKEDKNAAGNYYGAKVLQVSLIIYWTGSYGGRQEMNLIFRGQDAINI